MTSGMFPSHPFQRHVVSSRMLGMLVLLAFAPFVMYYGARWIKSPVLYDGDRLETRVCRNCAGSGRDEDMAYDYPGTGTRCSFCGGDGEVQVILPGPNRPSRIWGAVVSLDATGKFYRENYRRRPPDALRRVDVGAVLGGGGAAGGLPGAIAHASVLFEREDGEVIEVEANSRGRFSRRLAPGKYTVRASAPGHVESEASFEVVALEAPIWLEEATLVTMPESYEEAQRASGLSMLAVLSANSRRSEIRIYYPY